MKILEIELHTPTRKDIAATAIVTLLCFVFLALLVDSNMLKPSHAVAGLFGALGGSLAQSCGASIKEHGLPGVVVSVLFSIAMMVIGLIITVYLGLI